MRPGPAEVDFRRLKWVGPRDMVRPSPTETIAPEDQQRCIEYLEQCYTFDWMTMTPESYPPCNYGCDAAVLRKHGDESLTDGVWWFAGSVIHHMRVHGLLLPESVVADLRSRGFQLPILDV
jgi:hypothetical protein